MRFLRYHDFEPVGIVVALTNKCNFMCDHCFYGSTPRKRTFIDADVLKKTISELGARHDFILLTGGEPTLHPRFKEILEHADRNIFNEDGSGVLVTTNGRFIGEDVDSTVEKMKELGFGSSPNVNVQLSISRFHEQCDPWLKDKVHIFIKACERIGQKYSFHVSFTSEEERKQILKRYGVDEQKVYFARVNKIGRGKNIVDSIPPRFRGKRELEVIAISPSGNVYTTLHSFSIGRSDIGCWGNILREPIDTILSRMKFSDNRSKNKKL